MSKDLKTRFDELERFAKKIGYPIAVVITALCFVAKTINDGGFGVWLASPWHTILKDVLSYILFAFAISPAPHYVQFGIWEKIRSIREKMRKE